MTKEEVTAAVVRHGFSKANATTAVSRVARLVDLDDRGRLRLLQPGIRLAENLIASSYNNFRAVPPSGERTTIDALGSRLA